MRILLLTQVVVYPADAGPKIKTLQVLRHLAAQHEIVYCTFVRNQQEAKDAEYLRAICRRVVTIPLQRSRLSDAYFLFESLIQGDAFLLRRDERAIMHKVVEQLLQEEQIEVIHVDQLNMMRFAPIEWPGKIVLDEHNAVWQVVERLRERASNLFTRWLLSRELRIIRTLEEQACRRADRVLTVSEQDRASLYKLVGSEVPIVVVPISLDVKEFDAIRTKRSHCIQCHPQLHSLLTIGTMFWPPNSEGVLWWLRTGYARLQQLCPDIHYDIIGARPPHALEQLATQTSGVQLHGYVADVEPFWCTTTALLVPLLSGGGVRVKILEAMAMGVPVISTSIGCEGLAVRDNEHLLIADTPDALADACMRLMQEQGLAERLTHNALQYVLQYHHAKTVLAELDAIYQGLTEHPFCRYTKQG